MGENRYSIGMTEVDGVFSYVIWDHENDPHHLDGRVVFSIPDNDDDEDGYPAAFRAKYEELIGRPEFLDDGGQESPANLVEMIADNEECAFDQPCRYGHRVDGHAVYCHNERWLYAPRKCRRTWYTGGEVRDEDCRGYEPNPRRRPSPPPSEKQG